MGTGVTLAVCSPASFGSIFAILGPSSEALVTFLEGKVTANFTSAAHRVSENAWCGAWWKVSHSHLFAHTGGFSPERDMANWRNKLAFKNELHWDWLRLQPVVEQGLLLSVL